MPLSDLLKQGKIRVIPIDDTQINNALGLCRRDIEAAESNLKNGMIDWSFNISYNSMLQAGRALMYSYGYAPKSEHSHKSTLEFVGEILGAKHADLFNTLDRIRKKRHTAVYDQPGVVTEYEAGYTLDKAKEFVKIVSKLVLLKRKKH
jgi:uncharacterized protein (UPF0332 family)